MARARVRSIGSAGSERLRVDTLEARVRALDHGSRALLDLSVRRRMRDDDMAPILRIDSFNLAWRRARAIERLASGLGLTDPAGLAQVRAALPYLPDSAWCIPLALPPGPPSADAPDDAEAGTVEGSAITMEFEAIGADEPIRASRVQPPRAPEHAWGPRALAVRKLDDAPVGSSAPRALVPRLRSARALTRSSAARSALLAGAGAVLGALLSRRRR